MNRSISSRRTSPITGSVLSAVSLGISILLVVVLVIGPPGVVI